jgi:hypothetical protein
MKAETNEKPGHEGPWIAVAFGDRPHTYDREKKTYHDTYSVFGTTPDQPLICQVESWDEDGAADAYMLAAAPGLCSVLDRLAREAGTSVEYSDWPELQDLIEEADNMLAQARGEIGVETIYQYENTGRPKNG